jgi:hypothetical protein
LNGKYSIVFTHTYIHSILTCFISKLLASGGTKKSTNNDVGGNLQAGLESSKVGERQASNIPRHDTALTLEKICPSENILCHLSLL